MGGWGLTEIICRSVVAGLLKTATDLFLALLLFYLLG